MGLAEPPAETLTVPGSDIRSGDVQSNSGETMSSPVNPIGDPSRFSIMFWLPPGGTDNGVWASAWAIVADLESTDVTTVLNLLAAADVGGYVATPGGCSARLDKPKVHRLWVDSLQYHRAEDVLMQYFHAHSSRR